MALGTALALCRSLAAVPGPAPAPAPPARTVTLLYTGSTDGAVWACPSCSGTPQGGLARRATLIHRQRQQTPDLLLVDAGDLLSARARLSGDRRVLAIYRLLAYDAINVGDQEFVHGLDFVRSEIAASGMPFVSACLHDSASGALLFPPYVVREAGGVRVGILGVVDALAFMGLPAAAHRGVKVSSVAVALASWLEPLRAACDVLVVLSNLGGQGDIDLAEEVPGIQVIIGAHAGGPRREPQQVGSTLLCRPGHGGEYVGRLQLQLDAAGKVTGWAHELLPVAESLPADSSVAALVRDLPLWATGSQKEVLPSFQTGRLHAPSDLCADCHRPAAAAWARSAHAAAFGVLPPEAQGNLGCLPCHATGWARGGYVDAERTPTLQNVGCTACHAVPRKHLSWPSRAPVARVAEATCRECHTPEYTPGFDFQQHWARIRH